jgi:hypothetical protein
VNTAQLVSILDAAEIDPRSYRIREGGRDDGLCLMLEDGRWRVFFSERGERRDIQGYESEDEACVEFLRWIFRLHAAGAQKHEA